MVTSFWMPNKGLDSRTRPRSAPYLIHRTDHPLIDAMMSIKQGDNLFQRPSPKHEKEEQMFDHLTCSRSLGQNMSAVHRQHSSFKFNLTAHTKCSMVLPSHLVSVKGGSIPAGKPRTQGALYSGHLPGGSFSSMGIDRTGLDIQFPADLVTGQAQASKKPRLPVPVQTRKLPKRIVPWPSLFSSTLVLVYPGQFVSNQSGDRCSPLLDLTCDQRIHHPA